MSQVFLILLRAHARITAYIILGYLAIYAVSRLYSDISEPFGVVLPSFVIFFGGLIAAATLGDNWCWVQNLPLTRTRRLLLVVASNAAGWAMVIVPSAVFITLNGIDLFEDFGKTVRDFPIDRFLAELGQSYSLAITTLIALLLPMQLLSGARVRNVARPGLVAASPKATLRVRLAVIGGMVALIGAANMRSPFLFISALLLLFFFTPARQLSNLTLPGAQHLRLLSRAAVSIGALVVMAIALKARGDLSSPDLAKAQSAYDYLSPFSGRVGLQALIQRTVHDTKATADLEELSQDWKRTGGGSVPGIDFQRTISARTKGYEIQLALDFFDLRSLSASNRILALKRVFELSPESIPHRAIAKLATTPLKEAEYRELLGRSEPQVIAYALTGLRYDPYPGLAKEILENMPKWAVREQIMALDTLSMWSEWRLTLEDYVAYRTAKVAPKLTFDSAQCRSSVNEDGTRKKLNLSETALNACLRILSPRGASEIENMEREPWWSRERVDEAIKRLGKR